MNMEDIDRLIAFHGHLGPYAMIGLRMGLKAVSLLSAQRHFGIEIAVECADCPPQSCIVDGLQVSTGATYGKRNIVLVKSSQIKVSASNKKDGSRVCMTLTEKAQASIAAMPKDHESVEKTAMDMARWPDEDLFQTEIMKT